MNKTVTLDITIKGETRSVEFKIIREDDLACSLPVFAARIGNGMKAHRVEGIAWFKGGKWVFSTSTQVLNRNAHITDWLDQIEYNKSNHVGSKI